MSRTKTFHIVAWLTLFSIAFTVNTLGTDARADDGIATYSSHGPTRSHWTFGDGVVLGDEIRLSANNIARDGVVLGDRSIFCNGILLSDGVRQSGSAVLGDGVVLGDEVVLGNGVVWAKTFSSDVGNA